MVSASSASVPFSVLDLASVREAGTVAESFRHSVDLARRVERLGYTRFWLAEHHNMPGIASAATSVLIGHVAGATSTLRVGSGGIMLPNHAPLVIAEQFGTLDALYPDRIDLGLGRAPGSDRVTAHAPSAATANSGEHVSRNCWRTCSFTCRPRRRGSASRLFPGPEQSVDVWLLGSSTFSAQLAAPAGTALRFRRAIRAPPAARGALLFTATASVPPPSAAQPYAMVGLPLIAAASDAEANRLATSAYQRVLRLIRGPADLHPAASLRAWTGFGTRWRRPMLPPISARRWSAGRKWFARKLEAFPGRDPGRRAHARERVSIGTKTGSGPTKSSPGLSLMQAVTAPDSVSRVGRMKVPGFDIDCLGYHGLFSVL